MRRRKKRSRFARRRLDLTVEQILAWADEWFARTGQWPRRLSGFLPGTADEKWVTIDANLRKCQRGLSYPTSLARLLAEKRGVRNIQALPPYTEEQILAWADAHRARSGQWPTHKSGPIAEAPGETWLAVEGALRNGCRGLSGGCSLAQLLARQRGMHNVGDLPPLTEEQILAWADTYHARSGRWPNEDSGAILEAPGETWRAVDTALRRGKRGLPDGSSLPRLLARQRGFRNKQALPPLTEEQILAWADAHHRRTGQWPIKTSGPVEGACGDTWFTIDVALRTALRGLSGGSSLARLLARCRGVRNIQDLPPLTEEQILAWADAHHRRTGQWPTSKSGPVPEEPGTTWAGVNAALSQGNRGLSGGGNLPQLLAQHRGARNRQTLPPLTEEQILAWADAHHRRTGQWPTSRSGPVFDDPGTTWGAVVSALSKGGRGLPGGASLAQLIKEHRMNKQTKGTRNR